MTRRLIVPLLALLAFACQAEAPPSHGKMGAALSTPQAGPIVVGIDPSSVGMSGAVGQEVFGPGGLSAFMKNGPNATDWQTWPPVPSTSTAAGLMSAAQVLALTGNQASKTPGALQWAYTDVIDLTTTGTYVIIPSAPVRIITNLLTWEIKTTTSPTVTPTYSVGSNSSSFNNRCASQTTAALITQATETLTAPSLVNPGPALDISTSGLQLNVTGGGTATALTARLLVAFYTFPI